MFKFVCKLCLYYFKYMAYKHKLSLSDSISLVAGSMIGCGIFIVSADIARQVQSGLLLMLVWIIAGVALGAFIGSFIITLFIVIFPMLCLQDIYKQHRSVQRFKIKVCDTVTLKSGGKKYKVIKIEDGKAYCVDWVTKDGGCFPIKDLMLAND